MGKREKRKARDIAHKWKGQVWIDLQQSPPEPLLLA